MPNDTTPAPEPTQWAMERAALTLNRAYHRIAFQPHDPANRTAQLEEIALTIDAARREALEEAAKIVRGEVCLEHYREWPWFGTGSSTAESDKVQFADAAADTIRALASRKPKP